MLSLSLGGSLARGEGDEHSDVDIYAAVDPEYDRQSRSLNFTYAIPKDILVVRKSEFGGADIFHLMFEDGSRCDVHVFDLGESTAEEHLVELYDDTASSGKNVHLEQSGSSAVPFEAPPPHAVIETLKEYWSLSHTIAKELHRDEVLVAGWLTRVIDTYVARLFMIHHTKSDVLGPRFVMSTHALSKVFELLPPPRRDDLRTLLTHPLDSEEAFVRSACHAHETVGTIGRSLAQQIGFRYPADLERVVVRAWEDLAEERGYDVEISDADDLPRDGNSAPDAPEDLSLTERARRALVRQRRISECGVACLATAVRFYGEEIGMDTVWDLADATDEGTSLHGLLKAAEALGFEAGGYKADLENLAALDTLAILHVVKEGRRHYVICFGRDGDEFIIGDPESGVDPVPKLMLSKVWESRALLTVEPSDTFSSTLRNLRSEV